MVGQDRKKTWKSQLRLRQCLTLYAGIFGTRLTWRRWKTVPPSTFISRPSLPANTTVVQLLGAIELSLAELSNGDITEPELRQDLRKELESSAAALPQATAAASGVTPTPPRHSGVGRNLGGGIHSPGPVLYCEPMEQTSSSPPAAPVPIPQDSAPSRWSQLRDLGRRARDRGRPRRSWPPPWLASPRPAWPSAGGLRLDHSAMLRGSHASSRSPGLAVLAWAVGVGVLLATAKFVQTRAPRISRRAALQIVSLPWFPYLACVPVVLSIIQSGSTAHHPLVFAQ